LLLILGALGFLRCFYLRSGVYNCCTGDIDRFYRDGLVL
jgi:hypothetical protein